MKPFRLLAALVFLSPLGLPLETVSAALRLPAVIGDNMVLQQQRENPIWGWAEAGQSISVTLGDQRVETTADSHGFWIVSLPKMGASAEPRQIAIQAGDESVALSNVKVGEVWLCSGQSNMQWAVQQSAGAEEAIRSADRPDIHLFQIPLVSRRDRQDDVEARWTACTPETVPGFSAVAYYFAERLQPELQVPIGLIQSAWGGSRIEPWIPLEAFTWFAELQEVNRAARDATPSTSEYRFVREEFLKNVRDWTEKAEAAFEQNETLPPLPAPPPELRENNQDPTVLYNAMIHPVVPYGLRGAIWYQGESNVGEGMLYYHKKKSLIHGWRKVFQNPELSFHFVQLAPFRYGNPDHVLPVFWEAQTACLRIPYTGMAVINDISTIGDIHPPNKKDVGIRLALNALAKDYGKEDLVFSGPLYDRHSAEGGTIRIHFLHAPNGLVARDGNPLTHFEIAGSDGNWKPARAQIDGGAVLVSSAEIPEPVQVRFAWSQTAEPNLSNAEGLPAPAFRTHPD
ncbi:MAG TPA: sialate O-acetylesterase [Verrucomicrobiales bacterium]|nr:sialate O-acetylesterase [Verrucomicrobiales bacterium]